MTIDNDQKAWAVWRQDDHGQRFLVAEKLTKEQAETLAIEFEKRGHKQYYWVEGD
ncbi:MAG: hypothetical protein P1V97_16720 [Planctomycetota bacterium]|nr:hypothetical protein [Planctomycetota bacterium]